MIVATPMAGLRETLTALRDCPQPVAWLCKGFEAPVSQPYGLLGHEIRAEVAPGLAAGALSRPSFAQEVAAGQPTALVAASDSALVRSTLVAAFHGPALRVYATEDLPGVEVGGGEERAGDRHRPVRWAGAGSLTHAPPWSRAAWPR